jgi:hypothetical protein
VLPKMLEPPPHPHVGILNKQKCHFFFFSFAKSENRRAEQFLPGGGG